MCDSDTTITIKYKFILESGISREFEVILDDATLNLIQQEKEIRHPEWTKLDNFKCSVCTLDQSKHVHCPIALNILDIVDFFKEFLSYEETDVIVETKARTYAKRTSLQVGVSALLGIYMVTSGCPILEKLKPMVRYHLPFATLEETSYRIISMYLIAQLFLYNQGKPIDMELEKLNRIYSDVNEVNQNISEQLRKLKVEDAIINALVNLDCFASSITFEIYREYLTRMEHLYRLL